MSRSFLVSVAVWMALLCASSCVPPALGGMAITRPIRLPVLMDASGLRHEDLSFRTGDGLTLRGWLWRPAGPPRGLVVFIHGINDNRTTGARATREMVRSGWAVFAYDNRAHGASDGTYCTYGFREKEDVRDAITAAGVPGPVVLIGHSLGAAVALQAANDPRVRAVVALAPFSDLEQIIRDMAPASLAASVPGAIAEAERQAAFRVQDVSPRRAAAALAIPILVLHGDKDRVIRIKHSRSIYAEARTVRFMRVPGATHADVLWRDNVWERVVPFVDEVLPPPTQPPAPGGRRGPASRPGDQAQKNVAAEAITVRG